MAAVQKKGKCAAQERRIQLQESVFKDKTKPGCARFYDADIL